MKEVIVGLTEQHGMALEQQSWPPEGYRYEFLDFKTDGSRILKSPIQGFYSEFDDYNCDFVEAVLSPAKTRKPWFYSLACFEEALAFQLFGLPTPRWLRLKILDNVILGDNFKGFLFWSYAGLNTLNDYDFYKRDYFFEKSHVVYPAIKVPSLERSRNGRKNIQILFNGNFFIKGGANVVDCFEILQEKYKNVTLRLCCDEDSDFLVGDSTLKGEYLSRIRKNPNIIMGRVPRKTFLTQILPQTDIYLLPTYGDAFGFAILEAMAYGIPVVSTNYMAIPEMVRHGKSGYLADISQYNCKSIFKGCRVNKLPQGFKNNLTKQLIPFIEELVASETLRREFGKFGRLICSHKFSFENRKNILGGIYNKFT